MRIIKTKSRTQLYPIDVYVGWFGPEQFAVNHERQTIERYLHKQHIASCYDEIDLFIFRMDAIRAFVIESPMLVGKQVDIKDVSLIHTTVWGFQMVESEVSLENGQRAIVEQKKYVKLAGASDENYNDEAMKIGLFREKIPLHKLK